MNWIDIIRVACAFFCGLIIAGCIAGLDGWLVGTVLHRLENRWRERRATIESLQSSFPEDFEEVEAPDSAAYAMVNRLHDANRRRRAAQRRAERIRYWRVSRG